MKTGNIVRTPLIICTRKLTNKLILDKYNANATNKTKPIELIKQKCVFPFEIFLFHHPFKNSATRKNAGGLTFPPINRLQFLLNILCGSNI